MSKFVELRNLLMKQAYTGRSHFILWKSLMQALEKDPQSLNCAREFFGLTINAHIDATMLHLSRLIDTHPQSVNIFYFLDYVERNRKELFKHTDQSTLEMALDSDRKTLQKLSPKIENVKRRRNKLYAHIDQECISNRTEILKTYPVVVGDVEELFEKIGKILNRYSGFFDGSTWVMKILGVDTAVDGLLSLVKEGKEYRLKKFQTPRKL